MNFNLLSREELNANAFSFFLFSSFLSVAVTFHLKNVLFLIALSLVKVGRSVGINPNKEAIYMTLYSWFSQPTFCTSNFKTLRCIGLCFVVVYIGLPNRYSTDSTETIRWCAAHDNWKRSSLRTQTFFRLVTQSFLPGSHGVFRLECQSLYHLDLHIQR